MADQADKAADTAEKAYAAAVEAAPVKPEPPVLKASSAPAKAPVKPVAVAKPKPARIGKPALKKSAPAIKAKPPAPRPVKAAPIKSPPIKPETQTKEHIMAKTADFTKTVTDAVSELQTRAKEAYDKGSTLAGEATEFTKGNIEALVESGKIFTENFQDLSKAYAEEAKAAFETLTADMKEMAAIKSPTELFQLQGKLMRRNFDSMVAFGSKSSETLVKLTNEAMAPISGRMSLAADKISKAA